VLDTRAPERRAHLPGDTNVWVFVLGDLVYFLGYFVIFMIYRIQDRAVFLASQQHLNVTIATVNTLVLLASSRSVALAVLATRASDHGRATRLLQVAGALGALFAVIKVFEWGTEISRGYTLTHDEFFMFYFMLTATHLFHVLLGLGVLAYLGLELRTPGRRRTWVVEAGAVYWHMVDLVWIFMFALIYLIR
jgi:nitric oxide reductase NorE protein